MGMGTDDLLEQSPHRDVGRPNVTGHRDPDGEAPWAMQLVVRVERNAPPAHSDVCAASAQAVVTLLAQADVDPNGAWQAAVTRWTNGRIRKICRRARGAAWERAQALEGVTVIGPSGVAVRAFVPGPTDAVPRDLHRLQVSDFDLADPARVTTCDVLPEGPLVVSLCPDPPLPTGKAAAAAGHAAQVARMHMAPARLAVWSTANYPVDVEHPDAARWAELLEEAPVRIADAGFTIVEPGTVTAVARWA